MLIYNPAFDLFHSIFRILLILKESKNSLNWERVKILDFYLLFPHLLLELELPQKASKYKKRIINNANPYEVIHNKKMLFKQVSSIQDAAIKILSAYNFIETDYEEESIKFLLNKAPSSLVDKLEKSLEAHKNIIDLLLIGLEDLSIKKLKEKTLIINSKYDAE